MTTQDIATNSLNERQIAFANALVFDRSVNGDPKAAAIQAGYSIENAYQRSRVLLSRSDVQDLIRTNQRKSLAELATESLHVAREVLNDSGTPASTRVTLIKAIWAHAGLEQPQVIDIDGDKPLTARDKAELKAFVKENLAKLEEKAKEVKGAQVIDTQVQG